MKPTPSDGLTMGLADILQARAILLLVPGHHKVVPLQRMLRAGVAPRCPASFLWLHPRR